MEGNAMTAYYNEINVLCRDCPTHDLIGAALKRARNMADMEDE